MEITKEQVLRIHKCTGMVNQGELEKWFPKAFKVELEVGKVYRYKDSAKLIKITEIKNSIDQFYGYGFDWDYCYSNNLIGYHLDRGIWQEANIKEWERELIEEAKKRGFFKGVYFKSPVSKAKYVFNEIYFCGSSEYVYNNFGGVIFNNGVWAEIIKTISKEDAEKQLGCNII